jgi:hypothetical protein
MIRYLSTTGTDVGTASTLATAWATLVYAFANMTAGDRLRITPGTYAGAGTLGQEPPSGASDSARTIIEGYGGRVIIDGSDTPRCISLAGSRYVTLRGLSFVNRGGAFSGWSVTECVAIRDLNNTPGVGRNAHHILVTQCEFLECTRREPGVLRGAVPLMAVSYSDERLLEEACHHIEIDGCVFRESKSDMKDAEGNTVFAISQVVLTGNVRDWRIDDCVFMHDFNRYREGNGGIECVSNYNQSPGNYLTYPDQIRKGVVRRNVFVYNGPNASLSGVPFAARYAVYPHACEDVLIENNFMLRWPLGVGLVAEDGGLTGAHNTLERVMCRNNFHLQPEQYAFIAGAWATTYNTVESPWVVNNTVVRDYTQASQFPPISIINRNETGAGVTGEYGFYNNLVIAPDQVMLSEQTLTADKMTNNLWVSDATQVFRYPDYATLANTIPDMSAEVRRRDVPEMSDMMNTGWTYIVSSAPAKSPRPFARLRERARSRGRGKVNVTPSWYTSGLFGAYDTGVELDMLGVLRNQATRDIGAFVYG